MPEHTLFHAVFLIQILVISFYFPRKLAARMKYVFETYPPSSYPKLYPRPLEYYKKSIRNYRILNLLILLGGLLLLAVLLGYSRSGEWDHAIAGWYFVFQFFPLFLLDLSSLRETKLMRDATSGTTRKAELHPRRLLDLISPRLLGVAAVTYLAFIVLIVYVRQFDFPWFGGYWNIVGVTVMNLLFATIILRHMYGKKRDPHQAYEDRRRQIEVIGTILVVISIAATLFVSLSVILAALDLRSLQSVAQSLYFQLLAVASFQAYGMNVANFEVYKEEPFVT